MLRDNLITTDGTQEMISECIEVVKNADNVVIFGAGVGGAELYKL